MNLTGYDEWKTASPDDDRYEPDVCPECGGEGFVFECFDGCCEDADIGCDDCTKTCPYCLGRPIEHEPDPDDLMEQRREDREIEARFPRSWDD